MERGRSAWDDDKFARLAAQKLLEILGEAAKQVSDDVRARFVDFPWRDLARVRDVYTHAYHRVDFDLMWEQLVTQLLSLEQAWAGSIPTRWRRPERWHGRGCRSGWIWSRECTPTSCGRA